MLKPLYTNTAILIVRTPVLVPLFLVLASLLILGAALASQFFGGVRPCVICITQRYPYVIAIVLGGTALVFAHHVLPRVLLLAVIAVAFVYGAGIGIFHLGVENGYWSAAEACASAPDSALLRAESATVVSDMRCQKVAWSLFGISMAGFNVIASVILATVASFATWVGYNHES